MKIVVDIGLRLRIILIIPNTNEDDKMTYKELINTPEFKELEQIQNTKPNVDILTICGFMLSEPDPMERLRQHLQANRPK